MTSKGHKRHADILKPTLGNYARNEWAIVGTNCENIKSLAQVVFKELSSQYSCAYIDTKHIDEKTEPLTKFDSGIQIDFLNCINYQQVKYNATFNSFQNKELFNACDIVLANGNHHEAKAQIVVIDEKKKTSLQKRFTQLNNIKLILLKDTENDIFSFIKELLPENNSIPVIQFNDIDKIISFFKNELLSAKPELNGLILAGGKSIRLGKDKSKINWHGKEQRYYIADLLKQSCKNAYISCREEQKNEIDSSYSIIPDSFTGLGPYGAILSALREQPDKAWLIVACDLPLVKKNTIELLINNRNCSSLATTFKSPHDGMPEPLITIWEPKSYAILLSFLAQGISCPRKVLMNNNTHIIEPNNPEELLNVNTVDDLKNVNDYM